MAEFDLEKIVQAYNVHAVERDERGLSERKITHIQEAMAAFEAAGVTSVLEIGSGPGNAAEVFQHNGFSIECVDVSPKMIELVQSRGIPGRVLDCRELSSLEKTYDAVFSVNSLLHVPSAEFPAVLVSIHGILADNGLFALGLWGGKDQEGVMEDDLYEPKRYFVFYSQPTLLHHLSEHFWIEEYKRQRFGRGQHFHKVMLRKQ